MFESGEFWQWLSLHPVPSAIILAAVAAAIVVWVLMIAIAFVQGRKVRVWKFIIIGERPASVQDHTDSTDNCVKTAPISALIRPFREVNRFFLQVLIKRFQLSRREEGGVMLEVDFDGNVPAIWSRQAGSNVLHARRKTR